MKADKVLKPIILEKIPRSPNGMTESKLAVQIGITKRTLRRVIHELKEDGYKIVNHTDGEGYYIDE